MGTWLVGDIHVHSACDYDGTLAAAEIVERCRGYCDFLAITGHAREVDPWGGDHYRDVLEARRQYPDIPIFFAGEIEFPIPRHAIVLTVPSDREFELQSELVRRFDRLRGHEGIEEAMRLLEFVQQNWGENALTVFNHPNSPPVALDDLRQLATSPVFRILACYDRAERRAPQTWDIGAEWDQLLMQGHRIWVRFGSDFHKHFDDGGTDYYPGEFVLDQLWVDQPGYEGILQAYRRGRYFCTVDRIVSQLRLQYSDGVLDVSFLANAPVDRLEIISDGTLVDVLTGIEGSFDQRIAVPAGSYYRLRGMGVPTSRRYAGGEYVPVFLSNPVFADTKE